MKFLDSLEKRFGFLAVPNVALTLVIAQLFIYAAILVERVDFYALLLVPKAVIGGEWWRLFSFLISPPYEPMSPVQALFLAFFWYIFWMMSQTLESVWGVFRFNVFLLGTVILAIVGSFIGQLISPGDTLFVVPRFLYFAVFFAFATINPNIQFLIFFVIPMKVKWLAWIIFGFGFLYFLSLPSIGARIALVAPYIVYLLFFKNDFKQSAQARKRRVRFDAERRERDEEPLHRCEQCGATDKTHPERTFRYKMVDGDAVCICDACRE